MLSVTKISLYLVYYILLFATIYALFVGSGFWVRTVNTNPLYFLLFNIKLIK